LTIDHRRSTIDDGRWTIDDVQPMTPQSQHLPADTLSRVRSGPRTIRICHVMSADLWAGAEVQLATTASYLVERAEVSLAAVLLNEGRLANELRRLGINVTIIDETRFGAFGIVGFLTRFLRENQIDLVHTHRYKDSVLGTIAAKLSGVPHVIRTVHGLREPMTGWDHLKFRAYEALDKVMLLCFADLVIAVSRQMAGTLRDSGYKPTMVTPIHNGIDLRKVIARRKPEDLKRELGLDARTILIGTVGRLSPVKGHASFLRAARLILAQQPDARFLVVGGGPLEHELIASAAQLQLDGTCLFLGPRADVYDLVSAMDMFVLPSLDEGIPMAILEAMALGKPVVATAVGGVPEVVQHRVTGLLVAPGDERALADACLELARDRDWAQRLGAQARRTVEEEFSHEQSGRALIDAYRSVALMPKAGTARSAHEPADGHDVGRRAWRRPGGTLHVVPPARSADLQGPLQNWWWAGFSRPAGPPKGGHHLNCSHLNCAGVQVGTPGKAYRRHISALGLCRAFARSVLEFGMRSVRHALERRRMNGIRRNPVALRAVLKTAKSILIVCHGNIIRSPFAATLIAQALGEQASVSIASAGLEATPGRAPHPTALLTAAACRVDLRSHVASPLDPELVAKSDVIFVMEIPHLLAMQRRFSQARAKTFLLSCLAPEMPLEIRDPVDGDELVFQACFDHISRAVRPLVRVLSGTALRQ
jgi:L-malate glycosyltransferase